MRVNWMTLLWFAVIYVIIQKTPVVGLSLLIGYMVFKYSRKRRSAERILAIELQKTNKYLKYLVNISESLASLENGISNGESLTNSQKTSSTIDEEYLDNVYIGHDSEEYHKDGYLQA